MIVNHEGLKAISMATASAALKIDNSQNSTAKPGNSLSRQGMSAVASNAHPVARVALPKGG